jgi:hypothetical protein
MSEYTTEAESSVRARRQRRSLLVIGTVLLGLFFVFWYALSYYQAESSPGSRDSAPTCRPYDPDAVTPEQTTVNVYNATNRNGLAASVSKALAARGFVIDKVANDPSKRKAPVVAEVRHGPGGKAQAQLLLSTLPKGATAVADKRKGAVVDVALGAKFTTLPAVSTEEALPMCPAPSGS